MKDGKSLWDRLLDRTDLQTEPLPRLPLAELAGDRRLLVENHRGVTEYGPERIRIRVAFGTLCIGGCGLVLAHLSREQLVITGRIQEIRIIREVGA